LVLAKDKVIHCHH